MTNDEQKAAAINAAAELTIVGWSLAAAARYGENYYIESALSALDRSAAILRAALVSNTPETEVAE